MLQMYILMRSIGEMVVNCYPHDLALGPRAQWMSSMSVSTITQFLAVISSFRHTHSLFELTLGVAQDNGEEGETSSFRCKDYKDAVT